MSDRMGFIECKSPGNLYHRKEYYVYRMLSSGLFPGVCSLTLRLIMSYIYIYIYVYMALLVMPEI
jgi:hypothetical protein